MGSVKQKHTIIIATYGDPKWQYLAQMRAYPSAVAQGPSSYVQVVMSHGPTLAEARNQAANLALADYLTFLDADDELRPGYLKAVDAEIESVMIPDMCMYTPAVQYGVEGEPWPDPVLLTPKSLRTGNYLVIGTTVPCWAFLEVGGFKEWPAWEDWALYLRLDALGLDVVQVPAAVYRVWNDSSGRNESAVNDVGLFNKILAAHDEWMHSRDL